MRTKMRMTARKNADTPLLIGIAIFFTFFLALSINVAVITFIAWIVVKILIHAHVITSFWFIH